MSNSNWITDRPPTVDEVPDRAKCLTTESDGSLSLLPGSTVRGHWHAKEYATIAWMMPPEPLVPEVDTSLAASIERAGMFYLAFYVNGVPASDDLARIVDAAKKWNAAMKKNEQRPDLDGRLPIVYNGKSAEEWYTLYSQLLLKNTSDSIKAEFPPKFGPTPETIADVAEWLGQMAVHKNGRSDVTIYKETLRRNAKRLGGTVS